MRAYLTIVLSLAIAPILLVTISNYGTDPFEYFRKSSDSRLMLEYTSTRFMNPGFAMHYDYDGVVIGTSMTENFRPSQIDRVMGGRFIKLSMSGSTPYEERLLLQVAFRSKGERLRRVLWGLDPEMWIDPPGGTEPVDIFPDYLYGGFDIEVLTHYLASKDVFWRDVMLMERGATAKGDVDFDSANYWGSSFVFGCKEVQKGYMADLVRHGGFLHAADREPELEASIRANLEQNLLPMVERQSHTVFYLFIPPYSDAETYLVKTYFPAQLAARSYMFRQLKDLARVHSNVHLYDFEADHSITSDLSLYKDVRHYSAAINDWMVEYMNSHAGMLSDDYITYAGALDYHKVFSGCEP